MNDAQLVAITKEKLAAGERAGAIQTLLLVSYNKSMSEANYLLDRAHRELGNADRTTEDRVDFAANDVATIEVDDDFIPEKPKAVTSAVTLLIGSLVLGFINSLINATTGPATYLPSLMTFFIIVFTMGIQIFFIYQINLGTKWVRTVFLVFFGLGAVMSVSTISTLIAVYPLVGLIALLLTVLQLIALVMLFSREGNEWFNQKKMRQPVPPYLPQ